MKLIIGIIIGMLLGASIMAIAQPTSNIGSESLWNRVFDSTNNKINVIGV